MDQSTNFLEILSHYRNLVWPSIESYLKDFTHLPSYCQIDEKYSSLVDFHYQMVAEYPQRKGKYLRPTLLLLTAQALGVPIDQALNTATAMQISEDWILNHDDVEDDSLERRGQKALHRLYSKELAINAGDALHILMWHVLSENIPILGCDKSKEVIDEFYRMINRTVLGQTIEIKWMQENKTDLTEDDIFLILESKTGYYTIAGPMRLGAVLAGASDNQLEKIYQFGVLLGRSFQIIDDLLDLTSDFTGLKKQKGNDIFEGKRTLMLIHLLKSASPEDKQKIEAILSKNREQKSQQEVDFIINLMEQYGSLDYSKKIALDFASQAKKIFEEDLKFLDKEPFRSQLKSAIDFIVTRNH